LQKGSRKETIFCEETKEAYFLIDPTDRSHPTGIGAKGRASSRGRNALFLRGGLREYDISQGPTTYVRSLLHKSSIKETVFCKRDV